MSYKKSMLVIVATRKTYHQGHKVASNLVPILYHFRGKLEKYQQFRHLLSKPHRSVNIDSILNVKPKFEI